MLNTWEDKVIYFNIMDSLVHCNSNDYEQEGYTSDLCDGNYENNFDATILSLSIERDQINSSCIYSNIDNIWQNLNL